MSGGPSVRYLGELHGVQAKLGGTTSVRPVPAGRSRQGEVEGLAVRGGPFSDEVGDQLAVVLGCEHQGSVGRSTAVVAVHPGVPGVGPIHQIAHGSAPKGGPNGTRTGAGSRRRAVSPRAEAEMSSAMSQSGLVYARSRASVQVTDLGPLLRPGTSRTPLREKDCSSVKSSVAPHCATTSPPTTPATSRSPNPSAAPSLPPMGGSAVHPAFDA